MAFWVYILRCADNSYYTGHTDNLEKRIAEHHSGSIISCYTYTRRPLELVFSQDFPTRLEALASEQQIKGWSRQKKEAMMRGDWAEVSRLAKSPTTVRPELVVRHAHHNREAPPFALSLSKGMNPRGFDRSTSSRLSPNGLEVAMSKAGWQTKTLGELCRIRTGKKDVNQGNPEGEYPFFTCAAEHTYSDNFSFDTEALLIAGNGDVGKVSYYKGKFEAYQRTYVVSDFKDVLPRFLYLILDGKLKDTVSKQKLGNTMPYIKVGMLTDFPVPLPPLPEQQRIVGILDEAFDGIATAKANAEQNLQNARALFESHLQSVFTQRGEGWVEKTIGETCILRSGTTLPPDVEKPSGEIPYLKVADMNIGANSNGITCSSRYVNKGDVNASNLLPVGTTIFPKRGGAILTNKKRLTIRIICADLNIMGVTPKSGLLPEFLFYFFLRLDLREINNGSSIPQINNYSIEPLLIVFPKSTTEQQAIVAKLDALREETQRLESLYQRKLAALDELKKSLLHQAFSGVL